LYQTDPRAGSRQDNRLAQLVRSIVTPTPAIEVRQYDVGGRLLLVLAVEPGTRPPYGITLPGRSGKPIEFYVRRNATTFPAKPDEIRSTVLASAPTTPQRPAWTFSS
jgi:hypothetical protein